MVLTVEMPYHEFVEKFGPCHSDHPPDWDAAGPVELWFFELPWGLKVTLECHLTTPEFNIYVESLEIDAVLDFLKLKNHPHYVHAETVEALRNNYPVYTKGLCPTKLYRQDDNGNTVLMNTYESPRVAEYYQKIYEARGHKQLYWVEKEEPN